MSFTTGRCSVNPSCSPEWRLEAMITGNVTEDGFDLEYEAGRLTQVTLSMSAEIVAFDPWHHFEPNRGARLEPHDSQQTKHSRCCCFLFQLSWKLFVSNQIIGDYGSAYNHYPIIPSNSNHGRR